MEAGLDPRFRVLDQAQADTLLTELINDQLRDKLADQDEAVLDLIVRYGLNGLQEMVAQLLQSPPGNRLGVLADCHGG